MKEIIISENESNQRIDRFLGKLLPQASKGFLQKMLRKKRIKLNGAKSDPNTILTVGDTLQIYFSDETIEGFRNSNHNKKLSSKKMESLNIVFEDDNLLVLNKPVELLTQPDKTETTSLIDMAVSYLIETGSYDPQTNLTFTPACANRIDKNTSGLVIVPKTYKSLQMVTAAIREDATEKVYLTLVLGITPAEGEIIGYINKDPKTNTVTFSKESTSSSDKKAELTYTTLFSRSGYSLLKVNLLTGRSHQIRVQLAAIDFPILGDPKYGSRRLNIKLYEDFGLKSQLLHSAKFSLIPTHQTFTAPVPEIFEKILRSFGFDPSLTLEV
jgi:23S rRNA pseudouridine955/2504/2580 synthase